MKLQSHGILSKHLQSLKLLVPPHSYLNTLSTAFFLEIPFFFFLGSLV